MKACEQKDRLTGTLKSHSKSPEYPHLPDLVSHSSKCPLRVLDNGRYTLRAVSYPPLEPLHPYLDAFHLSQRIFPFSAQLALVPDLLPRLQILDPQKTRTAIPIHRDCPREN